MDPRNEYIDITLSNSIQQTIKGLYQYDHGIKIRVHGLDSALPINHIQMHFSFSGQKEPITVLPERSEDVVIGEIPDVLLMQPKELQCYLYIMGESYGVTIYEFRFPQKPREKPMPPYTPQQIDYFTDQAEQLEELLDESEELKDGLDALVTSTTAAKNAANTAATNADTKAGLANTAATNANDAKNAANQAATLANEKANLADTKATLANTKANLANTKANLADTAATNANAAAQKLENMDATASTLNPEQQATASVSTVDGHYRLTLGLPRGNTGENAVITQEITRYNVSDSGTTAPVDNWRSGIPTVPQGQFLWVRRTMTWNEGNKTIITIPVRQGIDGLGSVSSVNNTSPDANGNVTLSIPEVTAITSAEVDTITEGGGS